MLGIYLVIAYLGVDAKLSRYHRLASYMLVTIYFLYDLFGASIVAHDNALGKIVHRLFDKHQFLFVERQVAQWLPRCKPLYVFLLVGIRKHL